MSGPPVANTTEMPAIVMVDDEAGFADILKTALSGKFSVRCTTSPIEAVALCEEPEVRLLLTDLLMAEMDGPTLARTVRARRPDIECILFSGGLNAERWVDAVNSGCRHVLPKPISLRALLDICTTLVQQPVEEVRRAKGRDPRTHGNWNAALGSALRCLMDHMDSGKSPILVWSPTGPLPGRALRMFIPDLEEWDPCKEAAAPGAKLPHLNLSDCTMAMQELVAPLIAARRALGWILSARHGPEEMLDAGTLCEALYMRIGSSVLQIPAPGDSPEETLQLCGWYLEDAEPECSLSSSGARWLATQFPNLDWETVFSILDEALNGRSGMRISEDTLRRASLSVTLGTALEGIEPYPDFVASFAGEIRTAWDVLGRLPP